MTLREGPMSGSLRSNLELLARYHLWATERLVASVKAIPEVDYRADRGLFFGSLHGTLNHLLLADEALWLPRFVEGTSPAIALNAEIEPDRNRLAQRLVEVASRWPAFVADLPDDRLSGKLIYHSTQGEPRAIPFAPALLHVFNHATHHRGQATAAITAAGHEFAPLDLLVLIAAEARR
jgi:uncharacterized damage-inducible protein DinB